MTEFEMMNDEQQAATVSEALAGDESAVMTLANHAQGVEVYRYGALDVAMGLPTLPAFPSVRG